MLCVLRNIQKFHNFAWKKNLVDFFLLRINVQQWECGETAAGSSREKHLVSTAVFTNGTRSRCCWWNRVLLHCITLPAGMTWKWFQCCWIAMQILTVKDINYSLHCTLLFGKFFSAMVSFNFLFAFILRSIKESWGIIKAQAPRYPTLSEQKASGRSSLRKHVKETLSFKYFWGG